MYTWDTALVNSCTHLCTYQYTHINPHKSTHLLYKKIHVHICMHTCLHTSVRLHAHTTRQTQRQQYSPYRQWLTHAMAQAYNNTHTLAHTCNGSHIQLHTQAMTHTYNGPPAVEIITRFRAHGAVVHFNRRIIHMRAPRGIVQAVPHPTCDRGIYLFHTIWCHNLIVSCSATWAQDFKESCYCVYTYLNFIKNTRVSSIGFDDKNKITSKKEWQWCSCARRYILHRAYTRDTVKLFAYTQFYTPLGKCMFNSCITKIRYRSKFKIRICKITMQSIPVYAIEINTVVIKQVWSTWQMSGKSTV